MQILRRLTAAALVALPLFACAQVERYGIDGVDGDYCLPAKLVPPSIDWIPEDGPSTPQGFTFRGCAVRSSEQGAHCSRLRQIVSADVASRSEARFFGWKNFKKTALMTLFNEDGRTRYEPHGQQLVIRNEQVSDQWLILSRHTASDEPPRPQDNDVVVAMCSRIDDFPLASRASTGRNFGCYRQGVGPQYSFDYRFVTDSEIPDLAELAELDRDLIAQIDAWKCPAE